MTIIETQGPFIMAFEKHSFLAKRKVDGTVPNVKLGLTKQYTNAMLLEKIIIKKTFQREIMVCIFIPCASQALVQFTNLLDLAYALLVPI